MPTTPDTTTPEITTPESTTPEPRKAHLCRHIFTEGRQCGSPALRGEKLCYFHHIGRRPNPHRTQYGTVHFNFPEPEDLHAVQRSLGEVLRLLANRDLDRADAGPILRTLSIASTNLARIDRQKARQEARDLNRNDAAPSTLPATALIQDIVLDPLLGPIAPGLNADPTADPTAEPIPEAAAPAPTPVNPAELLLPVPVATPVILPDPIDEAILTHNLPTETVALFTYAKHELELFNAEGSRRRKAGLPPLEPPYILSTGLPIDPLELYLYSLEKFDSLPAAPEQEPDPSLTYPPSNEEFRTFAQCA